MRSNSVSERPKTFCPSVPTRCLFRPMAKIRYANGRRIREWASGTTDQRVPRNFGSATLVCVISMKGGRRLGLFLRRASLSFLYPGPRCAVWLVPTNVRRSKTRPVRLMRLPGPRASALSPIRMMGVIAAHIICELSARAVFSFPRAS